MVVLSASDRCFQLCAYLLACTLVACLSGCWLGRLGRSWSIWLPLVFVPLVALVGLMFAKELVDRVVVAVVVLVVCRWLLLAGGCRCCHR